MSVRNANISEAKGKSSYEKKIYEDAPMTFTFFRR